MKILVTCPPMLGMINSFLPEFESRGAIVTTPDLIQTLSVDELKEILPLHDGWIIGDDPAIREVFEAGRVGRLRAAVKWGVGVDNVDFDACHSLGIPIINTPNMFGSEVADIAMGYVIALARETFQINAGVQLGGWPKPSGISLSGKKVALIGFGDIGRATAKRLLAAEMGVTVYDPNINGAIKDCQYAVWPERIEEADFIVLTSALTPSSFHMLNGEILSRVKKGVRVINVGRGPLIKEVDLEDALRSEIVYSAALDVFEVEPLPLDSFLRTHPRCIFGSHNASNTKDAVVRTSNLAIVKLFEFLDKN